jgi:hypothetical protein
MFKNYLTPSSLNDEDLSEYDSEESCEDDEEKSSYSHESMLKKVGVILTYISVQENNGAQ